MILSICYFGSDWKACSGFCLFKSTQNINHPLSSPSSLQLATASETFLVWNLWMDVKQPEHLFSGSKGKCLHPHPNDVDDDQTNHSEDHDGHFNIIKQANSGRTK